MLEGCLIFMGGLLGSAHCLGMCGPFTLTLGSLQASWQRNLRVQLVYALGRILTYTALGAIAGFGGWRLASLGAVPVQPALSLLAGVFLLLQGLQSLGVLQWHFAGQKTGCGLAGGFGALLRSRSLAASFAAGTFNGLLPCGLVYAYLALASSAANLGSGALVMVLFGLGTVPALLLTGLGGSLLGISARQRLFRVAAWCMIATGVLACARGVYFWDHSPNDLSCPFCV